MNIVSVNVSLRREVELAGRRVVTGLFKEPVEGAVAVGALNLDGDEQADLSVHGGPDKAVYAFSTASYRHWRDRLGRGALPWGSFGENLTLEGADDREICVGDVLQAGTAVLQVTQPRAPCWKLRGRLDAGAGFIREFLAGGHTGFYLRVLEPGRVAAGDEVGIVTPDPGRLSVAALCRLRHADKNDLGSCRKALEVAALPADWRRVLEARLERGAGQPENT